MAGLARSGFDEATIARFIAERSSEHADDVARETAVDARRILREEAEKIADDVFTDPTGAYIGSVVARYEKTGEGYRAYLTVEGDEVDEIKALIIEYGRDVKIIYPVRRLAMKWEDAGRSKFKSGPNQGKVFAKRVKLRPVPGKHVLRRARDRAYQRIRSGRV